MIILSVLGGFILFSCVSPPASSSATDTSGDKSNESQNSFQESSQHKMKTVVFSENSKELKIEVELMGLTDITVLEDVKASGGKAVRLEKETSLATINVILPSGSYTVLVNEKAPSPSQDAFYVFLDERPYRCYPSDPPLGDWELTKRTPINLIVSETTTITLSIQPHSPAKKGETGMLLDYVLFIKD